MIDDINSWIAMAVSYINFLKFLVTAICKLAGVFKNKKIGKRKKRKLR